MSLSQFASFSLPCYSGSDEEKELNRFLRSRSVIQVSRQCILKGDSASWTLLVEYQETKPLETERRSKEPVDYRKILSEEVFARFRKLRELRKNVAAAHGVPVFTVFSNDQLASLAAELPVSESELMRLDGVGRGKCERFAPEFLPLLSELAQERSSTNHSP